MGYFRFYPPSAASTSASSGTTYFVWDAVSSATSYVLQVGTSTGASDRFNEDVGNVLTYALDLSTGTYYSRTQAWANSSCLSTTAEQTVTVA